MRHRPRSNAPEILKEDWRRWTEVIALIAREKSSRRRVDPQAYEALYRRLIAACREFARSENGATEGDYERLEAVVRPWLNTKVLAQADREILAHLLHRCRRIEHELGVHFRIRGIPEAWLRIVPAGHGSGRRDRPPLGRPRLLAAAP